MLSIPLVKITNFRRRSLGNLAEPSLQLLKNNDFFNLARSMH